jgi:protein involved in sex pheromone biosynthesis
MKKRTLILLALCLLLLTACTEKKDQIKEQTITKVNEKISDITNISENQIKKSYTYIKDNYTKFKDKKIYEELIYHIKYIQAVGKYTNNDLTTLANKTLIYIEKDSKKKSN